MNETLKQRLRDSLTDDEYRSLVWYYWKETLCAFGAGILLSLEIAGWLGIL